MMISRKKKVQHTTLQQAYYLMATFKQFLMNQKFVDIYNAEEQIQTQLLILYLSTEVFYFYLDPIYSMTKTKRCGFQESCLGNEA